MKKIASALVLLALFPAVSNAEGMALSGKVGLTTGYGADLNMGGNSLSGRVGFNNYNFSKSGNASSMDFDFKLKLQTVSALADWYPFEGKFRISGGIYNNKSKIEMTAIPDSSASYTLNGVSYPASSAVSNLQGRLTFSPTSPYLGIGWGNPVAKGKGWGMVSDVGVIFQGSPKYTLTATCAAALSPAQCTQLQADAAAEQAKQQADLNNSFKYWPVLSIGLTYQW